MNPRLPSAAVALGLAGLIPFVACGLASLGGAPGAERWLAALLGYGAVILAFLGGVQWGFVLGDPAPARGSARLAFGVAPSLIGWAALVLWPLLGPEAALAVLLAGFVATTIGEARLRRLGLVPQGYMWLRWLLSAGVVAVLGAVLLAMLAGAHVTF